MSTDDEIRDAFHSRLDPALSNLTVSPSLLSEVRRRHAHQRRLVAVGAPLGVAVVTAGSVTAAIALPGHGGSQTVQVGSGSTGPTATVLGHKLTFPVGWTVKKRYGMSSVESSTMRDDGTNTATVSEAESIMVTTPENRPAVTITVVRDGVGTAPVATATPAPGDPPTTISNGGASGGGSITCAAGKAHRVHHGRHHLVTSSSVTGSSVGASPTSPPTTFGTGPMRHSATCGTLAAKPMRPQVHYRFDNTDDLWAYAKGMHKYELSDFVHNAIDE
ncbi:MAG: hypothetical protein JO246_08835 [Frankiaceae bacterium]|nr:hypothetical protein [Frankiaceae bacterium]MBV9872133.1 hypothetical protein [Frankiaceae bacterium]